MLETNSNLSKKTQPLLMVAIIAFWSFGVAFAFPQGREFLFALWVIVSTLARILWVLIGLTIIYILPLGIGVLMWWITKSTFDLCLNKDFLTVPGFLRFLATACLNTTYAMLHLELVRLFITLPICSDLLTFFHSWWPDVFLDNHTPLSFAYIALVMAIVGTGWLDMDVTYDANKRNS